MTVHRAARTDGQGTILLVDDEWAVRRMMKRALERDGYTVLLTDRAEEGDAHLA